MPLYLDVILRILDGINQFAEQCLDLDEVLDKVEDAKSVTIGTTPKHINKEAKKHEYSKKELDSLFDNIYEVEI